MNSIDSFLNQFLGEFTPVFTNIENVGTYMFLDVFWILKALLLIICTVYVLKGFFQLLKFIIIWR